MAEASKRKPCDAEEDPESSAKRSRRAEPSESGATKLPPSFLGQQTIVTIALKHGDSTEIIPVHKNFICHYSPFFNAAFNGDFVEGQTQQLELEDNIDPEVFNLFVNWLYTQEMKDVHGGLPSQDRLCKIWILADRFLIPKLQNKAMSCLLTAKKPGGMLNTDCALWVYLNTTKGSRLRDWVADIVASAVFSQKPTADFAWASKDLLLDALTRIRLRVPEGTKLPVRTFAEYKVSEDLPVTR